MANGYAIGAVTGRKEIMKVGEKEVFVSSTFFPNSLSFVAALKTIEFMEREKVLEKIWDKGRLYMDLVKDALKDNPFGIEISGIPPMSFITFQPDPEKKYKERRVRFYTELIRRGIFQQPYHHGYICYRHTEEDLRFTADAIAEVLTILE